MMYKTEIATGSVEPAALAVEGPQPVWMTLNQARERAFTGELVFEADPEVLAYLDDGVVYYAERAADAPLGQRLLDAGVLDATQLERGMVRIGDLEHLGRIFDRDPSIDRDAVTVLTEVFTEELIADLANRAVADVRVTAYRHHPSGVHRWFVAPIDQVVATRPMAAVGQLDGTVIDDLPGLPYGLEEDELMIEWDAITVIDTHDDFGGDASEDDVVAVEMLDDPGNVDDVDSIEPDGDALELSLELAEFVDDDIYADAAPTVDQLDEPVQEFEPVEEFAETEFSVVWPDGSEDPAELTVIDLDEPIEAEPVFTETDEGELHFSMPPLELNDGPEAADAEVSDDVADAVRRAIAAIESASVLQPVEPPPVAAQTLDTTEVAISDLDIADSGMAELIDEIADAPVADGGLSGFAPPTMAMRAEVLYGQMSDDGAPVDEAAAAMTPAMASSAGAMSVDGHSNGDSSDRSSALRRLIGGLRRKDH
jgi:hypothetical protein